MRRVATTSAGEPERLPVAVRGWPELGGSAGQRRPGRPAPVPDLPRLWLVLDTETTTDVSQRLQFGWARMYRVRPTDCGLAPRLVQEWLIGADDLGPADRATLEAYAASHLNERGRPICLIPRDAWVRQVLMPAVHRYGNLIVGLNLPFDLSRLAVHWGDARGREVGGFSLDLTGWTNRGRYVAKHADPRVLIKTVDSKRHLIALGSVPAAYARPVRDEDGSPSRGQFRGHWLDVRTLYFALTNEGASLRTIAETLGVDHPKGTLERYGEVTEAALDYGRRDVLTTFECAVKLVEAFDQHPISPGYRSPRSHPATLQVTQAFSPASIGKAYLRAMGIVPRLNHQSGFPRELLGAAMAAYFGGRAEACIVRKLEPVVMVDFLSMYTSVNTLLGHWRLLIADRLEVEDATDAARAVVAEASVGRTLDPATWDALGCTLVACVPSGGRFPVRAQYGAAGQGWTIGCNPLFERDGRTHWFMLPDLVASRVLGGPVPEIRQAWRLVPHGVQPGLRPVHLGGRIPIDPTAQDFFKAVIELRQIARRSPATDDGQQQLALPAFLKCLANATAYGILAEFLRHETAPGQHVDVVVHAGEAPFAAEAVAAETPGPFAFPAIAANITAGARLLLALVERMVTDAGGAYVMADTDSLAIVATEAGEPAGSGGDGPGYRALSWAEVDAIRSRIDALHPYDRDAVAGSLLQLTPENVGADGKQRQLWALAFAAKRYALAIRDALGRYIPVKVSEHGLGHLLDPTAPPDA